MRARCAAPHVLMEYTVSHPLSFPLINRTKGVGRTGTRNDKTHTTCRRCGNVTYHIQKKQCASCGYGRLTKMRRCK